MRHLLRQIPELHSLFFFIENNKKSYPLNVIIKNQYSVTSRILDDYNLGLNSFLSYLHVRTNVESVTEVEKELIITLKKPLNPIQSSPFLFDLNNNYYISPYKDETLGLPEVVVHYLLLYNLSMICRYETEWWGELFHYNSEKDYPFIETFLTTTKDKVPYLLFLYLDEQIEK